MAKRIALAGGGTGGHIYPLVSVVDYLKEKYLQQDSLEFLYLGPVGQLEKEIIGGRNIPQKSVLCGKMRRYFSFHNFVDAMKVPIGVIQALWHLFWFMPDVLYAKGGYASVPVVMAARVLRIPVLIHESDAFPGLANRFLGSLASRVAICFERAKIHFPPSKTFLSGMPVKNEAINGDASRAREYLQMNNIGKPVVLFFGGSQGARNVNEGIIEVLPDLIKKYQVVHITGRSNFEEVCQKVKDQEIDINGNEYRPIAYVDHQMKDLYALAEVVVARAGATSIAEIAANQKPCLLVPLATSANDHQRINAYEIAKGGGAIVLEEDNFKRGMLLHYLDQIANHSVLRDNLIRSISKFYYSDANQKIGDEVMGLIK